MLKLRRQPDYKLDLGVFVMQINYETLGFLHLPRSPHIIIWCVCVRRELKTGRLSRAQYPPPSFLGCISIANLWATCVNPIFLVRTLFQRASGSFAHLNFRSLISGDSRISLTSPLPKLTLTNTLTPLSHLIFVVIPPFNSRVAKLNLFLPFPIFLTLYFSHSVPVLC